VQTMRIFQRDGILETGVARGEQVRHILGSGLANVPHVREVRGLGLMWGIELHDPVTGLAACALAKSVQQTALHNGLIVELGGRGDNVVRIMPPLNSTAELIGAACELLVRVIANCAEQYGDANRSDVLLVGADA
jgi:diaminobutyrate-2-oxoglutarate transaminase